MAVNYYNGVNWNNTNIPSANQILVSTGNTGAQWQNVLGTISLRNSINQTISNSTNIILTLGTIDIATTNSGDLTGLSNTVTCVSTGIYLVNVSIMWNTQPFGTNFIIRILVNGSAVYSNEYSTCTPTLGVAGGSFTQNITQVISCNSNDAITIQLNQNSGGNIVINGSSPNNAYLQVKRLG